MKKIAIALALVMIFALASVALAFEASDYTLGANSTTPARALKNISRGFSAWYASGTFGGNSSKRLTVRPYKAGSTTAIASHAYTFTISQVSGGHDYTTLYSIAISHTIQSRRIALCQINPISIDCP